MQVLMGVGAMQVQRFPASPLHIRPVEGAPCPCSGRGQSALPRGKIGRQVKVNCERLVIGPGVCNNRKFVGAAGWPPGFG